MLGKKEGKNDVFTGRTGNQVNKKRNEAAAALSLVSGSDLLRRYSGADLRAFRPRQRHWRQQGPEPARGYLRRCQLLQKPETGNHYAALVGLRASLDHQQHPDDLG